MYNQYQRERSQSQFHNDYTPNHIRLAHIERKVDKIIELLESPVKTEKSSSEEKRALVSVSETSKASKSLTKIRVAFGMTYRSLGEKIGVSSDILWNLAHGRQKRLRSDIFEKIISSPFYTKSLSLLKGGE